ncbi:Transcription initiation factor TFIID subunit 14 [Lachnellula cervina]|uniref:Transcription initiation factor TFIID subunit 14 n=1 Tax=Lachnellula cervina TaxID=1316786 RepID=A0A7D8YQU4_9HELO|nr:Transcription initiation factor TFIID subunit 14 [Lachnellula cervina]
MVAEIKRTVKLITEQKNIDKPSVVEGFPMKTWNIEIYLLDEAGNQKPATCFTKAVYNLHESFANPIQTFTEAPFRCENEGWGEFDMLIDCYTTEKGGKNTLIHDLNFHSPHYETKHPVVFKNPSASLVNMLRETGPVGDENGARKKEEKKRKRPTGSVDMEKLADGLVKLDEEQLLHVVQLIHDNKSDDTYTKNDIEQGEFHVDLYTLPEALVKMLWDYILTTQR